MTLPSEGRTPAPRHTSAESWREMAEACLDLAREARKGVPEVVYAGVKSDDQVIAIVREFLDQCGHAVVSRLRARTAERLRREFDGCQIDLRRGAHAAAIHVRGYVRPRTEGQIGILTAGTADVPVAEEARLIAEEMGCSVATLYDVGVAGLHRLLSAFGELMAREPAVLIVCAGMDGALPSVVAGLVDVPVIGVPTRAGYGAGGRGRAALLAMLQSCSPGLVCVNIGNGVGAGVTAAMIANRVAAARKHHV